MIRLLRKFVALSGREKRLAFSAFSYLLLYRLQLVYAPPKKVFAEASARIHAARQKHGEFSPAIIAAYIERASVYVPFSTCLSKVLAGASLCADNGHPTCLHIGVRFGDERNLDAHAWLSYGGKVLLGNLPQLAEYAEMKLGEEFPQS